MSLQQFLRTLNLISDLLVFELSSTDREGIPTIFQDDNEHPMFVAKRNQGRFKSAVREILDSIPQIRETTSEESLLSRLIPIIRAKKLSGQRFTSEDAQSLKKSLERSPVRSIRIVKRLYGVSMSPNNSQIKIGDFLIDFGSRIFKSVPDTPIARLALEQEDETQLFIEIGVKARDTETADKLADSLLYSFEQIFRVLIGKRTTWVEVGVMNYSGPQKRNRYRLEGDRLIGHGSSWEGAVQPYILNHERFPMPIGPMLRLFDLITRSKNDFERHILRAAEWVGQAIAEPNESSALVKAAIALEVLFSTNEKGIITPSIMAQIAESCALLLGSATTSPVEIEKLVKHLYRERSAVVHSGRNTVKTSDLNSFISISRTLILLLLSKEEFASMKSMEELKEHLKKMKYSACL